MFGFGLSRETIQLAKGSGYGWQQFLYTSQPYGFEVAYEGGDFNYHFYKKDGEYHFGCSYRADPKIYDEIISPDKDVIERWFIVRTGDMYRSYNHLPQILLPCAEDEVKSGYEIVRLAQWSATLKWTHSGEQLPMNMNFDGTRCLEVVKYSHVADLPMRDLARSYLNPAGLPLMSSYLWAKKS